MNKLILDRFKIQCLLFACSLFASAPLQASTITLNHVKGWNSPLLIAAQQILEEAYQAIGIQINYIEHPAERALLQANSGAVDGEIIRVSGLVEQYPNLIQVPVALLEVRHMAFVNKSMEFEPNGWQSLLPYKLVFHRGYKAAEKATQGMNIVLRPLETTKVFQLLSLGRAEIAVSSEFNEFLIAELKIENIKMLKPPLAVEDLYHYLHKDQQHLVEPLVNQLQLMKKAGRFEQISKQVAKDF